MGRFNSFNSLMSSNNTDNDDDKEDDENDDDDKEDIGVSADRFEDILASDDLKTESNVLKIEVEVPLPEDERMDTNYVDAAYWSETAEVDDDELDAMLEDFE